MLKQKDDDEKWEIMMMMEVILISTDLLLDLDQQVYPPDQILLITFEMCFNYVVKIICSEFS